jgi:glycosyltransferase involved in cell wall biosynthesis
MLANVLSPLPYTIAKYRAQWLRTRLRDLCSRERFDIVQAEGLHMAGYAAELGDKFDLASVLRAQNIESDIMEGFHRRSSQAHIKAYAYLQLKKIRRYEPMICERVDQCIMISDEDERRIRCMNPRVHASTVPAGVDESFFKPMPDVEERGSLVFVGSFGWAPNLDGIEWFLQDVFPSIRQAVPEARLYVVGKEPPQRLTQIRTPGVVVTGFVQDVRTFMARGAVFVAPLRMGSGVRIKILNAMAMARPIVTTTLGAQGLDVADGEHLLIADSPELFADRVVELLLNAEYRRRLGNAARELIGARYTWEHATALLEKEYQTLLAR